MTPSPVVSALRPLPLYSIQFSTEDRGMEVIPIYRISLRDFEGPTGGLCQGSGAPSLLGCGARPHDTRGTLNL